jgi:membrane protease YdiL (CAAX protease family)
MHVSSSNLTTLSSQKGIRSFLQRHALVCYFLMAYGFSWIAWIPFVLSQDGLGLLPFRPGQAALLPGAYLGPLLSGLLMTAALEGKPGVGRLLRRFVQWRVGWYWYPLILCGVPIIIMAGFLAQSGAEQALHIPFPQLVLFFPLVLIMEILTSGLAEEPGWRGFALPRLQQRFGSLLGSCLLGLLWGGWHLPLYLTDWGNGAGWLEIGEFILGTVSFAIMFSWVFNHTRGSLLIAILLHATIDAFTSTAAGTGLFSEQWLLKHEYLAILLGFGAVALVLVVVTRGRLGYRRASSPPDTASTFKASS